jgi:hypothetical protein
MEIKFFQGVVGQIRPLSVLVDAIEGAICGLHWGHWNVQPLVVERDSRDPGCDTEAGVAQLTEPRRCRVCLLDARYVWAEC